MRPSVPDTGSTFMQRLGYYILGISLGLLILGWFQVQKMRTKVANGADTPAQVEETAPPPSGKTPLP